METLTIKFLGDKKLDDAQFWKLIAQSKRGTEDSDEQAERLTELLKKLPPDEICNFDRHFTRRRFEAYRWDLWGVAYIINGGCSDDGFEYFRCWLIGQGQTAYETVLASPEKISRWAKDPDRDYEGESLMYAADHAYEAVTGEELPPTGWKYPEIVGEKWEEPDLERLFPRLCKKLWW